MKLNIIPSEFFLPLDSVKLGRMVKSVDIPTQYHFDPPYLHAPEAKLTVSGQFMRVLHGEKNSSFASKLTSLMSSGISKRSKTLIRIETDEVKTYILDNSEAW